MNPDRQPTDPENNAGPAPETAVAAADPPSAPRPMNRHLRRVLDHLWGPTGSIILHILLVFLLVRFVTGMSDGRQTDIEVMVIDPEQQVLDDLQKELDQIKDVLVEITPPDATPLMEQPPDPQPQVSNPMEDFAALEIKAEVQSPLILKGLFANRTESGRAASLRRFAPPGRGGAIEAAVDRALQWLKERQLPDGSWEGEALAANKVAMTGLALLTFLSHGETTTSEKYGDTVRRAIEFLVNNQNEATGRFRSEGVARVSAYAHGIATYAISEAYALTRIPAIRPVMERALAAIIRSQQPTGGHTYEMQPHRTRRDTSIMSWMSQAMKAGYLAGADVPGLKDAMEQIAAGLKMNYGADRKLFAYAPDPAAGDDSAAARWASNTMQATLCLLLLGHGGSPECRAGIQSITDAPVNWGGPGVGLDSVYNWYYCTQALFHTGGRAWDRWNREFSASYLQAQNADGSWTPMIGREVPYGPVYGTCFAALTLMVYYRFLPTYEPIKIEEAPTQNATDDVMIEVT